MTETQSGTAQKILTYLRTNAVPAAREHVAILYHEIREQFRIVRERHQRQTSEYGEELRNIIEPSDESGERQVHQHAVLLARARIMRDRIRSVASSAMLLTIVGVPTLFIKVVDSPAAHAFGIRHLHNSDVPAALSGAVAMLFLMYLPSFLQSHRFSRQLIGSTSFCRLWEGIVFVLALAYGALVALPWHPAQFLAMFVPCGVIVVTSAIAIVANYCVDLVGVAYPDSYPLSRLLIARSEISEWDTTTEIKERASAAQEIEAAANHILHFWPRELRNLDNVTNRWFAAQCGNLVTHFVAAEREILWANDGFARARDSVDLLIRAFVTDGLVDLATTPRSDIQPTERDSYLKQVKSVITGALPLVTLKILHVLKLPMPQNVLPWLHSWPTYGL